MWRCGKNIQQLLYLLGGVWTSSLKGWEELQIPAERFITTQAPPPLMGTSTPWLTTWCPDPSSHSVAFTGVLLKVYNCERSVFCAISSSLFSLSRSLLSAVSVVLRNWTVSTWETFWRVGLAVLSFGRTYNSREEWNLPVLSLVINGPQIKLLGMNSWGWRKGGPVLEGNKAVMREEVWWEGGCRHME